MRNIVFEQSFHGVGQGLFYSGKITFQYNNNTRDSFNFVYDCGSANQKKYLYTEIEEYKKLKLQSKKLDLLMISHLHSDHVNGLENLLSDIEVENVVLPYLRPIERLILSVLYNRKRPHWYFEFLSNPTAFFRKRDVKNIIYVSRGKDVETTPPKVSEGSLNEVEFSLKMNFKGMNHDREKKENAKNNDEVIDINVTFKKDCYPAKIFNLWNFYFYVSPIDENKLEPFYNAVKQIQNESKDREITHDLIIEIIRDENKRKKLKEIYKKKITQDLNLTSMACLQGPIYLWPNRLYNEKWGRESIIANGN
ncbi:MAG: MBL fold metallo-hydrolase, partial [Elusimicrobiota bacterium]